MSWRGWGVSLRKLDSLPFRLFPVIWVEISNRLHWDSLPFSPVSRCLGRDFRTAVTGISTFSAVFFLLGRDFQQASSGFSTLSTDFRYLVVLLKQKSAHFSRNSRNRRIADFSVVFRGDFQGKSGHRTARKSPVVFYG